MNHKTVQVMRVIRTTLAHRGDGSESNPVRMLEQYWTMDGDLIFEIDPMLDRGITPKF